MTLLPLALLMACSTAPTNGEELAALSPSEQVPIVPSGWVRTLGLQPDEFMGLLDTQRPGWVAMHAHDYTAAADAFSANRVAQQRAQLSLAVYHSDVARVVAVGSAERAIAWSARQGSMPIDAQMATELATQCADLPALEGPAAARMTMHQQAVTGAVDALVEASTQPLLGNHFDPCVDHTLSRHWAHQVWPKGAGAAGMATWGAAGLSATVFGPLLVSDDLVQAPTDQTLGSWQPSGPFLPAFPTSVDDDPEVMRVWVRDLDAIFDSWAIALRAEASNEGLDLLDGLEPVRRYRQEVLVVRARQSLLADRPKQALALLERARDASARDVGPTNSPSLFALTAEAHVRLGHAREALDALHPLASRFPSVFAAQEIVGDLAVLQGMDRRGDSKENP